MKALNALAVIAVLAGAVPLRAQPMEDSLGEHFLAGLAQVKSATQKMTSDRRIDALSKALASLMGIEGESICGGAIAVSDGGMTCVERGGTVQWRLSPEEFDGSGFKIVSGGLIQDDASSAPVLPQEIDAANRRAGEYLRYDPEFRRAQYQKTDDLSWTLAEIYKASGKLFGCARPANVSARAAKPVMTDGALVCRSRDGAEIWRMTSADFRGTGFEIRGGSLVYTPRAVAGDDVSALKRQGAYVSASELEMADQTAVGINLRNLKR